jgi:RND family efflux transporter MFP subunit
MHNIRLLLLLLPLALGACFERAKPTTEDVARPVQVMRVALVASADSRFYAGVVRPKREADIAFRAGGRMAARLVDVGARVTAGQELARLDPVDLALAVKYAASDLAGAEAQNLQAQSQAARSSKLHADGWVATATDEVAQATAHAAAEKVAASRASLALAKNQLDYAQLRAPVDGVITATLADPGTVVAQGTPVLRMAEAGALEVEVELPEAVEADVAAAHASVTVWTHPDIVLAASLRQLAPSANPGLRTYAARYTLSDTPAWLAMGMTATVRLAGAAGGQGLAALPASALTDRGSGPMVWVVEADRGALEPRPVTVQALRQDRAFVAGLKQGELVVTLGVQKLDPLARVRVAEIRPLAN